MWFIDILTLIGVSAAVFLAVLLLIIPGSYTPASDSSDRELIKKKIAILAAGCAILLVVTTGVFSTLNVRKMVVAEDKGYTILVKGKTVSANMITPQEIALADITVNDYLMIVEVDSFI